MSESKIKKFGTFPVFLTSISTILGAILFLRFGWAVGQRGLGETLLIVLVGHLVTIPTSLAIAEIATNQRVEGGGAYYIISRSFGLNIGGAIGIALYLSQAISVAFYVVAFAQSTAPVFDWVQTEFGYNIDHFGYRLVSIPTMALLAILVMTRGANSGMSVLYLVAAVLALSLVLFFLGPPEGFVVPETVSFYQAFDPANFTPEELKEFGIEDIEPVDFFQVFTIIFPAFTGIIAGLGLSGDLKDPGKSIPIGTLSATVIGMVVYVAIAFKFAYTLPQGALVDKDALVMQDIALWGPIIPLGLACAAISSALGSILVAPRTLQALGADKVLPIERGNRWLSQIRKRDEEPINGALISIVIAFIFVFIGEVDQIAEIISMFFMVTYGAICLIAVLEHFSANPAYRPSFNSRWYFSLPGALLTIWLMFKMKPSYAWMSIALMVGMYFWVSRGNKNQGGGIVRIFQGVIFQTSRTLRVMLQKAGGNNTEEEYWVPSLICISQESFDRIAAFDMVRFIAHRYGFGTYIHMIKDYYSRSSVNASKDILDRLLKRIKVSKSNVYVDTMISPSYTSAVAQTLQIPGISGQNNNMILFEYSASKPDNVKDIVDNYGLIKAADFDVVILRSTDKGYGYKHELHLWLTMEDYVNGNLLILLSYIILGHPEWKGGEIKIFAIYPEAEAGKQKENLLKLINDGRLAISPNNVEVITQKGDRSYKSIINERSVDADLIMMGFRTEALKENAEDVFTGYDNVGNMLFVNTDKAKIIS
ncbi:MAG: amino acid permease [Bacteroidota bacterium]